MKLQVWKVKRGKYLYLGEKQCDLQVDRRVAEHDTVISWLGGGLGAQAINECNVDGSSSQRKWMKMTFSRQF